MMIHRRYLAREVSGAILLVLLALLSLFSFFDLLGEIKGIGQGGYQLHHAFGFVLLRLPGRAYELLPLAVLIGTLYALSALARHSEITVLRVSGLSVRSLLGVLFQVAAWFAVATFLIGEFVAPSAERAANQMRMKERGRVVGQDLRSGLWVKDEFDFINVRVVLPDGSLRAIRIYSFDQAAKLRSVTEAAEGAYVESDGWHLTNVVQTILHDDHAEVQRLAQMPWRSALTPEILAVLMVSPDRMSLRHLSRYTKHLADNHQTTSRYDIAFWKKMLYPLAAFVMVALAVPFGAAHHRVDRVGLKLLAGVMIGILFYTLNGLFATFGALNKWPPLLSAAAPSILFLMTATGMIWWVEKR